MINTILIGELIYNTLSTSTSISESVSTRIWPLIAPYTKPEDVIYPFIVFSRTNISSKTYTKDGWYGDNVSFQIIVESDKYVQSAQLANSVRSLFEDQEITDTTNNIVLYDIKLTNISENFTEDTFIQTLFFNGNVENIE